MFIVLLLAALLAVLSAALLAAGERSALIRDLEVQRESATYN